MSEKLIYRPPVETLAGEFCHILHRWLGPGKMAKVVAENARRKATGDDDSCATHDYCDANVAMDEAFRLVTAQNASSMMQDDAALALWARAWGYAKERNFQVPRPYLQVAIHLPKKRVRRMRFGRLSEIVDYVKANGGKHCGPLVAKDGNTIAAIM